MPRDRLEPYPLRRHRRLFWLAIAAAGALHALVLWLVVLPSPGERSPPETLFVEPLPIVVEPPAGARPELEDVPARQAESRENARAGAPLAAERPVVPTVAIPTPAADAPETETISATGLTDLHAATLPLEATGYGIARRTIARDPARIARMRAESLIGSRVASAVETVPPPSAGPFSLANGGVTIAIPWGGFVRGDRKDETWREERCRGKAGAKSDKPGEGEARRGQCS